MDYWAIVPAAGLSKRMKQFKLLLPWSSGNFSGTVIESTILNLLNAGVNGIVVVTGHRSQEVKSVLQKYHVKTIVNPEPSAPMGSSVSLAVDEIPGHAEFMLMPGDHPAVQTATIQKLLQAHDQLSSAIHVPVYNKQRGHPAVFPKAARSGLKHPDPKIGVRALFRNDFYVAEVMVDDPGILMNLDYPEDYRNAQKPYSRREFHELD